MSEEKAVVATIGSDYAERYGFRDPENYVFKSEKGLTREIVEQISLMKGEPDWMRERRLQAFEHNLQRPTPTWGGMVSDGRDYLITSWWVSTFPGLAILITVLGINFFGDWVRDSFDPRLKNI